MNLYAQDSFRARMEWGQAGVAHLAAVVDVVVIVDVLSFSTAVEVALSRGAAVLPCWEGDNAAELAERSRAALAVPRRLMDECHPFSLSPQSMEGLNPGERLVLPSPNGAAISQIASDRCQNVLCGCLRNADAVAAQARQLGETIAVIAAGERWPTSTAKTRKASGLRPALEDLIGAGAILNGFPKQWLSPEAIAAVASFRAAEDSLETLLMNCVSGRELCEIGFPQDVAYASRLNCSGVVPRLQHGSYQAE